MIDFRVETADLSLGKPARRETNTMPQWAGSCWYYLRFMDPKNSESLVDKMKEMYWSPVDVYVGGAEHAVLHLLYSRFWHKVQYMACRDSDGNFMFADSVDVFGEHHQERIPDEKVTEEIEGTRFNTGISAMTEFINAAYKWDKLPRLAIEPFVLLLSPYEELWFRLGHSNSLASEPFLRTTS
ncbi:hypothetical protein LOK49_LG09G00261 [Camellia lanceoleosa]|uniref:Uncharacterized protein n=1 Tax=Camellia lanceoleosa TaxID=1840588 RepID=A0ACC0GMH5_9ERIC|nr:hypothetical protein LOK49_LG09G00261 [Camellia lanceoleosa]